MSPLKWQNLRNDIHTKHQQKRGDHASTSCVSMMSLSCKKSMKHDDCVQWFFLFMHYLVKTDHVEHFKGAMLGQWPKKWTFLIKSPFRKCFVDRLLETVLPKKYRDFHFYKMPIMGLLFNKSFPFYSFLPFSVESLVGKNVSSIFFYSSIFELHWLSMIFFDILRSPWFRAANYLTRPNITELTYEILKLVSIWDGFAKSDP